MLGLLVFSFLFVLPTFCAPNVNQALVVSSTESVLSKENGKEDIFVHQTQIVPQIYEMRIKSNISNRFSHTTVVSKVRNSASKAQEASFSMLLPESAFISGFIMEVGGKNYTAYVKEKEKAKHIYEEAIASGFAAAHVAVNVRDSNRFTISVNIRPEEKVVFYLFYEQFLVRKNDLYEQIINIHPGQPVKNLGVEIVINESRKIIKLKAPPLRTGNEIGIINPELDPRADIEVVNDTSAIVKFEPNLERQKELAHIFGTKEENGLVGQFVVQYDVERDPQGGEVLVQDGYFVHFFAPTNLQPLPKHIVFILDTSGSMRGQKLQQLKEAMHNILDELHQDDYFNLVEFNSNTRVWNLHNREESIWYPQRNTNHYSYTRKPSPIIANLKNTIFPKAYPVNSTNIQKAKEAVSDLKSDGSTGMFGALQVGLRLVELERISTHDDLKRQPIIIFLTDGQPTDKTSADIVTMITELNADLKRAAIFTLAFGEGADKNFLQNLAFKNNGFSKPIYVAADTSLQLQDFYQQISSPLLSNITFIYEPSVISLTKTNFPIHFRGSEIVVAGYYGKRIPSPTIDSVGINGPVILKPTVTQTVSSMERLWAYLTINQLLEKKEAANENITIILNEKALELALKYSFVTPVSSLVVVQPNKTETVNTDEVQQEQSHSKIRSKSRTSSRWHHSVYQTLPNRLAGHSITQKISPRKSKLEVLLETLPWLSAILKDGFLTVPQGSYKLGINETIFEKTTCSKTPLKEEGHCSLLHDCPKLHSVLKTASNFYDHFCVLKTEFAGVCCPN